MSLLKTAYEHIRTSPNVVFLDDTSANGTSLLFSDPRITLAFVLNPKPSHGLHTVAVYENGTCIEEAASPFEFLDAYLAPLRDGSDTYIGAGYFSYELGECLEVITGNDKPASIPAAVFTLYAKTHIERAGAVTVAANDAVIAFAQSKGYTTRYDGPIAPPAKTPAAEYRHHEKNEYGFAPALSKEEYASRIQALHDALARGDVYQVNLTDSFHKPLSHDAVLAGYEQLRERSPAPYAALLHYGDFCIVSNSPERFLTRTGTRVYTSPIKGTRPRGTTSHEDDAYRDELEASEKDAAEHLMIVDLERNDLGKRAAFGSVAVSRYRALEAYYNVWQLVSDVEAQVADDTPPFSIIASLFPGGSVTGAPKKAAMTQIAALEPNARDVYCGAIGYVKANGDFDFSIPIRTGVWNNEMLSVYAGGGIVADSDAESEYNEMNTKARTFFECF